MAQDSWFWTTGATGDGATAYTQAKVILWQRQTFVGADNEGVLKDYLNELATTGATSPVATNTGGAYVHGFPYNNSASVDTAIPTPSSNTRIDRLVLRANWSAQTVRITRIAGTEGSGTPPAMTQTDGTTWDIPLYQVSITTGGVITLTDEREFLHPNIAVNTDMLDDDAVTLAKMADNSVDSPQYVDGSIDKVHLAADIVDGTKIADDAIDSEHITTGAVDLDHMSVNSVDTNQYVDGSIYRVHLLADIIDGTKIEDDAVDSEHYVDGSIDRVHLAADIVDGTKIEDDAIDSEHVAAGAVDLAHMSANSVDSDQYVDGSIDTVHVGNDQITTAKIPNRTRVFFVPAIAGIAPGGDIVLQPCVGDLLGGIPMADGVTTTAFANFIVPNDFVSTMTVKAVIVPSGTGNFRGQVICYLATCGQAYDTHTNASALDNEAVTTNQKSCVREASLTNAALNDTVSVRFVRDGGDAGDTVDAEVALLGFIVSYTADS